MIDMIKDLFERVGFSLNFKQVNYDISNLNQDRLVNRDSSFFNYEFMMSLDEKDYSKYLAEAYYGKTGEKLNLKHPKTINEKVQWLKIYDNSQLKSDLTDKVKVRDHVREKIGEEYLKPALWIGESFDKIPFESLPTSFIIKANHGCKWHIIVKNKDAFLANKQLYAYAKVKFENWLKQTFFGYSDFEVQYINIKPQIIIEPLMRKDLNAPNQEFWVWCVDSVAYADDENKPFCKEAMALSAKLAKDFKFVRVDWMIHNNQLYFCEMTFTPFSGYFCEQFRQDDFYKMLAKKINIKKKR